MSEDRNAADAPAHDHPFVVQFNIPHALVRSGIAGLEAQGKGKGVELRRAVRPHGREPAAF